MRSIYKFYKERLIEISGRNRSLFSKNISKKYSYDIGKLLDGDYDEIDTFFDFLWKGRRTSYSLISKDIKPRLYKNLKLETKIEKNFIDTTNLSVEEKRNENLRRERLKRDETKKAMTSEVNALKSLKREIEEFAKETGRYEMYVGYPFVQGAIGRELVIKAPLILFPVIINVESENSVSLELKHDEPIQLNKVFILAYAKHYKLNIDDIMLEYDNLIDYGLKSIDDVIEYLKKFDIKLTHPERKGMYDYLRTGEPKFGDELEVKHLCVVGRFPLANSIYNDYVNLDKHKLSSEAIDELLEAKPSKKIKKPNANLYTINSLDFAQENAIEKLNYNGNMVIYGPPGTGKSQTIVNIITDALCKHKRVLVVSQKKAALDVVFNRLGLLNSKAMFVTDAEKNKIDFYERVKNTHASLIDGFSPLSDQEKFNSIESEIQKELNELDTISKKLFSTLPFGLTLQEMYANSYIIGKNTSEYETYQKLLKDKHLMKLNYSELNDNIRVIKEKHIADLYYKYLELKKNNPLIDHIKSDLDVHSINQARMYLTRLASSRIPPFDMGKYPNARQFLATYLDKTNDIEKSIKPLIKFVSETSNPKLYKALKTSYIIFPAYPIFKYLTVKKEKETLKNYEDTISAVKEYISDYNLLSVILDEKGYSMTLDNILNGNTLFLKLLLNALDDYVEIRDLNITIKSLNEIQKQLLNFSYKNTKDLKNFKELIGKILIMRIYHEIVEVEDKEKATLSKIMNYESIKNRIISLKNEEKEVAKNICLDTFKKEYIDFYNNDSENKNFLYQITKQQALWPIRKMMEIYGDYLLNLFPCWLLSPESVSTIMPLKKDLFDLILFDEASQVFIESTLPTIYRGKYIVVAGDSKQLRPTATFMKRYMGNDDDSLDLTTQAALEVESLLDLATSRYNSTNLTYHYRSKSEELINFSNYAFYDKKLQIAPNVTKNIGKKPIERIKVNGKWLNRHNEAEAKAVVETLKKIFKTRKHNQSIGIITFNTEQEECIEDAIDEEKQKNPQFNNYILKELNRKENGEDTSLFIKNLENVQGDERDIIIFSIGYAKNEYGKVVAHFGPLSVEGGENRLNVAITRAKEKIYVITSIEPEELQVEGTKNAGPKIFKGYLNYARAISQGKVKESKYILENLKTTLEIKNERGLNKLEEEIKIELEKYGYEVETNLGNCNYKISLGVYDKKIDRFLLGIECDYEAYYSSSSILERDVFRPKFLESRGWKLVRVWSRDWWLNKEKVIQNLISIIEKNKTKYENENLKVKTKTSSNLVSKNSSIKKSISAKKVTKTKNAKSKKEEIKKGSKNAPKVNIKKSTRKQKGEIKSKNVQKSKNTTGKKLAKSK